MEMPVQERPYGPLNLRGLVWQPRSFGFNQYTAQRAVRYGCKREPTPFELHRWIAITVAADERDYVSQFVVINAEMSFRLRVDAGAAAAAVDNEFIMLWLGWIGFRGAPQRYEFGEGILVQIHIVLAPATYDGHPFPAVSLLNRYGSKRELHRIIEDKDRLLSCTIPNRRIHQLRPNGSNDYLTDHF